MPMYRGGLRFRMELEWILKLLFSPFYFSNSCYFPSLIPLVRVLSCDKVKAGSLPLSMCSEIRCRPCGASSDEVIFGMPALIAWDPLVQVIPTVSSSSSHGTVLLIPWHACPCLHANTRSYHVPWSTPQTTQALRHGYPYPASCKPILGH